MLPVLIVMAATAVEPLAVLKHEQLHAASLTPIVVTPDGQSFLYLRRDETREEQPPQYTYCAVDLQGREPRALYTSALDSEDVFCMMISPNCVSADGRSLLAVQTRNNRSVEGIEPGAMRLVPVIAPMNGKGEPVRLECESGSTTGVGFAGNDAMYLDSTLPGGKPGYKLKLVSDGQTKTIHQDLEMHALVLHVSPSGRYAAFFVAKPDSLLQMQAKLRVVDLKSGKAFTSPQFHTEAVTFDGPPLLYWDGAETGLFTHVSTSKEGRIPFQLTHWSFASDRGRLVTGDKNLALLAVVSEDWLGCWSHVTEQGCLLDAVTGQQRPLRGPQSENVLILGGRGRHLVITTPEQNGVFTAEIALPTPSR